MDAVDDKTGQACFCIHFGESVEVSSADSEPSKRRRFFLCALCVLCG